MVRRIICVLALLAGIALPGCDFFQPPPAESAETRWLDTFESYTDGVFPTANWTQSGNAGDPQNQVTTMGPFAGNHVLQLKGVYGGNWSAVAYRAVDLSSSHIISFKVRNSDWGGTGNHRFNAAVDLMSGPDWAAGGRWLVFFDVDGKVRTPLNPSTATNLDLAGGESVPLGDYENLEWYDVEIWYKRTVNSTVVLSFTINGTWAGVAETPYVPEEWNLAYVGLWSGDTTVWFDDVGVLPHG